MANEIVYGEAEASRHSRITVRALRAAATAAAAEDLAPELARTVGRSGVERVTCRRVAEHHYRCNWWEPHVLGTRDVPSLADSLVTTSRICRSRYLHVRRSGNDLVIRDDTR